MNREELSEIVRYNDAASEEHGFVGILSRMGFDDFDAVMYVSSQRALRAYLIANGRISELEPLSRGEFSRHSDVDTSLISIMQAVFMDGLAAGAMAERRNNQKESQ